MICPKKNLCSVLLLLCVSFAVSAQTKSAAKPVMKKPNAVNAAPSRYSQSSTHSGLTNTLLHDTCLDKKFSVVFYIIQDSLYSLPTGTAMPTYQLPSIMNLLNTTFKPICVSFEHCKTVIVPNYSYNRWFANTSGKHVITNWYTDSTINIYIPTFMDLNRPDQPNGAYNYPYPSPTSTDKKIYGIAVSRDAVYSPNPANFRGSDLLHCMGHLFGLPHTFDEINPGGTATVSPLPPANASPPITTLEFVNRLNQQNCLEHGDGFCDTEADPYPALANPAPTYMAGSLSCADSYGLKDGFGDYYTPACDNLMSMYPYRCRFTQQQYNYMARFIALNLLFLH